ncbi:MAG TPA: hypothetical protein PLI95_17740 [Polyangiaceae bacterium]|nr:hypothetical protein [Polyangiaceae bacterium]
MPPRTPALGGTLIPSAAWAVIVLACSAPALAQERSPSAVPPPRTYVHLFAFGDLGDSLRLNNPFRLSNQLGDTGESLSRTPVYSSLGGGAALGDPNGWQHGLAVQWSRQLAGLPQNVITPSYVLLLNAWRPWIPYARAGLPIILNPDANVGAEAAVGASYMLLAGIGAHAELVGSMFYGAATWEIGRTTIPMLSLQIGITADYEVLP